MSIRENIVDLLDPFKSGWYYNPAMGKSFSIKSVLPALFPDDPELNYHNLEDIHNGSEAMNAFPRWSIWSPKSLNAHAGTSSNTASSILSPWSRYGKG